MSKNESVNSDAKELIFQARTLAKKGEYKQAEIYGKAVAFEALQTKDFDLLQLSYILLADITSDENEEFAYFQGAYEVAQIDPEIYVRTCFTIIYKMLKMDTLHVLRMIEYLMSAVSGEFKDFLVALYSKLNNEPYDSTALPTQLAFELKRFEYKETAELRY